ncbi:MAG: hypothetical protein PHE27_02330 [Alphaproteobacteria bacterium]|nr:hypothetical protein [Alphaproteobacteria bacterium]
MNELPRFIPETIAKTDVEILAYELDPADPFTWPRVDTECQKDRFFILRGIASLLTAGLIPLIDEKERNACPFPVIALTDHFDIKRAKQNSIAVLETNQVKPEQKQIALSATRLAAALLETQGHRKLAANIDAWLIETFGQETLDEAAAATKQLTKHTEEIRQLDKDLCALLRMPNTLDPPTWTPNTSPITFGMNYWTKPLHEHSFWEKNKSTTLKDMWHSATKDPTTNFGLGPFDHPSYIFLEDNPQRIPKNRQKRAEKNHEAGHIIDFCSKDFGQKPFKPLRHIRLPDDDPHTSEDKQQRLEKNREENHIVFSSSSFDANASKLENTDTLKDMWRCAAKNAQTPAKKPRPSPAYEPWDEAIIAKVSESLREKDRTRTKINKKLQQLGIMTHDKTTAHRYVPYGNNL